VNSSNTFSISKEILRIEDPIEISPEKEQQATLWCVENVHGSHVPFKVCGSENIYSVAKYPDYDYYVLRIHDLTSPRVKEIVIIFKDGSRTICSLNQWNKFVHLIEIS